MEYYIIGLGNPGEEYKETRHNTGRMAVELFRRKNEFPEWSEDKNARAIVSRGKAGGENVILILPETFMNKSGEAVKKNVRCKMFPPEVGQADVKCQLIVVHDDLDVPAGSIKIAHNRGGAGHKGVESIIRAFRTKAFTRVRLGIAPAAPSGKLKKPKGEKAVHDFVLGEPRSAEKKKIAEAVKNAADAAAMIVTEGREKAMNEYN